MTRAAVVLNKTLIYIGRSKHTQTPIDYTSTGMEESQNYEWKTLVSETFIFCSQRNENGALR
jgi:hypothetical protein